MSEWKKRFPLLEQNDLVYFDNGATTLKPHEVSKAMRDYDESYSANIHRGNHDLSEKATEAYETVRHNLKDFIKASSHEEIIFTKGTTEGINLVAATFPTLLSPGDEILITQMEHHSNIVPWQMACEKYQLILKWIPITKTGEWDMGAFEEQLTPRTKLFACNHISNSLGTINPLEQILPRLQKNGTAILVDAAQSIAHRSWDVQQLPVDFMVFSGHKMFGPTGVGVLYGKKSWLDKLPPYQGGGDMIEKVTMAKTIYATPPHKFEAGTPPISAVIGLGAAIDFIKGVTLKEIARLEKELLDYATKKFSDVPGLTIYGTAANKTNIISFTLGDIHPHDLGTYLNQKNIAIRSGHHCTQPVMDYFGIPGTARVSLAFYNTKEEIDRTTQALIKAVKFFEGESHGN